MAKTRTCSTDRPWTCPSTAFDVAVERKHVQVKQQGKVPEWMRGKYVRNGPGDYRADGHGRRMKHLFDGYAALVGVELDGKKPCGQQGQLTVTCLDTLAYKNAKHGRMKVREFATTPLHSSLGSRAEELLATIATALGGGEGITDNASVNVVKEGTSGLLAMTETRQGTYLVDPDTLQVRKRLEYAPNDRIRGDMTTAHPWWDSTLETWINYSTEVGQGYHVWSRKNGTVQRRKIATVQAKRPWAPTWMHSFATSKNRVLLAEQPMFLNLAAMTLGGQFETPYYNFDWVPQEGTRLNLVNRATGGITQVHTEPFFSFHFINAFDAEGEDTFVADVVAYKDPNILVALALDNMERAPSTSADLPEARLVRLTVRGSKCEMTNLVDLTKAGNFLEYPTVNPAYTSREYTFVYGVCAAMRPLCVANGLCKINIATKQVKAVWQEVGCVTGEPCFVAAPNAREEDDGVVLSIVNGPSGVSFLLVLDGQSFQELSRLDLGTGVPYGFHGTFVGAEFAGNPM